MGHYTAAATTGVQVDWVFKLVNAPTKRREHEEAT